MRNAIFQRTASFAFCFGSSLIPLDFGEHVARHPRIVLASKVKSFLVLAHGDVILRCDLLLSRLHVRTGRTGIE